MLVPVEELNEAVVRTVNYARTMSPHVTALHVTDEPEDGQELREVWDRTVLDVPLLVIDSPYRSFIAPVMAYIDTLTESEPAPYVTVVLPEFRTRWPWQRWLHNQSARRLRACLFIHI